MTGYATRVSATITTHCRFASPCSVWRFMPGLRGPSANGTCGGVYEHGLVVCVGPRITTVWACDANGHLVLDRIGAPIQLSSDYQVFAGEPNVPMAERISALGYTPLTD